MNKTPFLFFSLLFFSLAATAQRQNLYFLKNTGEYVKQRDSADYLRIVKEPEQGSELYPVNEHFLDGSKKSMGYSSKIDPPMYEGQYICFYANGKKKMIANYKKGKLIDTAHNYYPNGNLYTTVSYDETVDGKQKAAYIKSVKDSTGKDLVIDGNGDCAFYDAQFKRITERGRIKNGVYDGEWVGEGTKTDCKYKEIYADGKLISGESTDNDGTVYSYTNTFVLPQFKKGMNAFYTYLKKTVRYPEQCYKNGIQGKVLLKFTVTKEGVIEDIKVLNDVHPALASEAVRVLKASPPWDPGIERGKPVNVSHNVPVSFTLQR
ncbi:TonB family protein [Pedobacter nyackensis]|uniref:TonB family protein n=1 Tax=Pedobacter nyackensis TaxID=475255 RepID=UPI002930B16D|nr:TonB family protein [Pedobacter nyackensis]